jgi:hypothetical protein
MNIVDELKSTLSFQTMNRQLSERLVESTKLTKEGSLQVYFGAF